MEEGGGRPSSASRTKDPGWYPFGSNPNDQAHWDGQTWTARRRWTGGGWADVPLGPDDQSAGPPGSGASAVVATRTMSYTPPTQSRGSRAAPSVGAGWSLVLLLGGIAIIVGSANTWASATAGFGRFTVTRSLSGTTNDGPGWVSLIAGIVLIVAALGLLVGSSDVRRLLAPLAAAGAGAAFAISLYFINQLGSGTQLGWG